MQKILRVVVSLGTAFFALLMEAWSASAQPIASMEGVLLVTDLQDELNEDGDCSLREAIEAANTNTPIDACGSGVETTGEIAFDVTGTVSLTSQQY